MMNVILDNAFFTDVLRFNSEYDSFCTVLNCSLIKLHENADLYACVRSSCEGIPCKLYIANNCETIEQYRANDAETEWIEAVGTAENASIFVCRRSASGNIEKVRASIGTQTPTISESLCHTMNRLSNENNCVSVIHHKKCYGEEEKAAFQKRSVLDLAEIDSSGVDIIYFDGADKLIEKLLYGGCRELTVFIADTSKAQHITNTINKISRKAPFSNRIVIVVGNMYAPKTKTTLLVGNTAGMAVNVPARIFFSVNFSESEGVSVSVGQNTADLIPVPNYRHLKPHTIHYITSIMSELVLRAISKKEYHAKILFNVNAKTLFTETIIKED